MKRPIIHIHTAALRAYISTWKLRSKACCRLKTSRNYVPESCTTSWNSFLNSVYRLEIPQHSGRNKYLSASLKMPYDLGNITPFK